MSNNLLTMLKEVSRDLPELMSQAYGIPMREHNFKLDYSEKSLVAMEKMIDDLYPLGHEPMPTTIVPFGIYLGDVLLKNLEGAEWKTDEANDNIFEAQITFPQEQGTGVLYPFQRIIKFWKDREDSISAFYRMANLMNLNFLNPEKNKEGEWIQLANGDKFRYISEENHKNNIKKGRA